MRILKNPATSPFVRSLIGSPLSFRLLLCFSLLMTAYFASGAYSFSFPLHHYFEPYWGGPGMVVYLFIIITSITLLRSPASRDAWYLLIYLILILAFGIYDGISHHWGLHEDPNLSPSRHYHPLRVLPNICLPLVWMFAVIPDLLKWVEEIQKSTPPDGDTPPVPTPAPSS